VSYATRLSKTAKIVSITAPGWYAQFVRVSPLMLVLLTALVVSKSSEDATNVQEQSITSLVMSALLVISSWVKCVISAFCLSRSVFLANRLPISSIMIRK